MKLLEQAILITFFFALGSLSIAKPQKKAMPLTKDVARKRIMAMKGLNGRNKFSLVNRLSLNQHSPRRVVRLARELARLR